MLQYSIILVHLSMQKKKRGGKRKGAGRPKTKEDTKVMRVPLSKVETVNKIIKK